MNRFALIAVGSAMLVAPALAHHSAAAVYDVDTTFRVDGTITGVDWMNPHVRFYVDVEDADGNVTNYEFETGGPGGFVRRGLSKDDAFPAGEPITVVAYPARDGSAKGVAIDYTLPSGERIIGGGSDGKDGEAQPQY